MTYTRNLVHSPSLYSWVALQYHTGRNHAAAARSEGNRHTHIQEARRKRKGSRRGRAEKTLVVYRVRHRDSNRVEPARRVGHKDDAERFAAEVAYDISRGDFLDPSGRHVILSDLAVRWLSTLSVKPKTRISYVSSQKPDTPSLRHRRLENLRPSAVHGCVRGAPRRVEGSTVVLPIVPSDSGEDRLRWPDTLAFPRVRLLTDVSEDAD